MNFARDDTPLEDVTQVRQGSRPRSFDQVGGADLRRPDRAASRGKEHDVDDPQYRPQGPPTQQRPLPLALEQLDLTRNHPKEDLLRQGRTILIITSKESLPDVIRKRVSATVVGDQSPKNKAILEILEMPISPMSFNDETPLEGRPRLHQEGREEGRRRPRQSESTSTRTACAGGGEGDDLDGPRIGG